MALIPSSFCTLSIIRRPVCRDWAIRYGSDHPAALLEPRSSGLCRKSGPRGREGLLAFGSPLMPHPGQTVRDHQLDAVHPGALEGSSCRRRYLFTTDGPLSSDEQAKRTIGGEEMMAGAALAAWAAVCLCGMSPVCAVE
ncbi:hypothetical protein NHX12_033723, partial [Muraenolepis orangiensis]